MKNKAKLTPEQIINHLDYVADLLAQAEDIIEELNMEQELKRLVRITDEIVCERDYIAVTELHEVRPRAYSGIYNHAGKGN